MAKVDWSTVGDNLATMLKWSYWIVGIIIVYTISHVLYTRFDKQVAAVLVFIASMLAMYYYYVKWFIVGQELPFKPTVCPDFMTSVGTIGSKDAGTLQTVCVDYTGNYTDFKPAVGTSPSDVMNDANNITKADIVNGYVSSTGANTGFVITPIGNVDDYCGKLKQKGISHISLCTSK